MNLLELSAILYYADFLSLLQTSTAVSDTCKYFFIYDLPVNACIIAGVLPIYDINNPYFLQAYKEYIVIKDKFGEEGIYSFLANLCNLKATGTVNGELMLLYIHRFDTKKDRLRAYDKYLKSKKNQTYTHITEGIDGLEETECTKYVAHAEQSERFSLR